jgi:hypothetical protein
LPRIDVTYDLANGTVSGRLEAEYECTADACMGQMATGAVQAEFGPIAFERAPIGPPPDWPFPEHHWYELSDRSWFAMQAVDVAVQLSGTGFDGRAGSYDTVVRGWVQVELSPLGGHGEARPDGWQARVSLKFDYPDTVPQQWYLWLGMDGSIWDPRIAPPTEG